MQGPFSCIYTNGLSTVPTHPILPSNREKCFHTHICQAGNSWPKQSQHHSSHLTVQMIQCQGLALCCEYRCIHWACGVPGALDPLHTPKHWSDARVLGLTRTMLIMKASQTAQTYTSVQEILERNMATPLGAIELSSSISIYLVISSTLLWVHLVVGVFPTDLLKKHFLFKTEKQLLIMLP